MSNARATLKSVIIAGVIKTCEVTGLRAGPQADALVSAILERLASPSTSWALRALADEVEGSGCSHKETKTGSQ